MSQPNFGTHRVVDWPAYLLRDIPPDVRAALTDRAMRDDCSLVDVCRQALCERYGMTCEDVSFRYEPHNDTGTTDTLILRLQPELYWEIKQETRNRYGALRQVILESVTAYLEAP